MRTGIVVFPGTVMPLNVGRQKSKALLDEVMPGDKIVGVCTQKVADVEDPAYNDLYGQLQVKRLARSVERQIESAYEASMRYLEEEA